MSLSFSSEPISEAAVSARPITAVQVFEVPCIYFAFSTIAVVSVKNILALPSLVIALVIYECFISRLLP